MTPVTILETSRIAPPPHVTAQSLPITFFDMFWLYFHPIQRLLFYKFPCSKSQFQETIVPNFKNSLCNTLQHFLPLAGNLIFPPNSSIPEIHFQPGDSLQLTVAESSEDSDSNFDYLTGNQPRDANEFYPFTPEFSEPNHDKESGCVRVPLFAVQITLFPDTGISIGFVNHHALGDANSIVGFIKAWSSVNKLGDDLLAANHSLPFYDRSVIKDPSRLKDHFWNTMKYSKTKSTHGNFHTDKFRATFILQKKDIQKLRDLVQARKPYLTHLSSFTIATSYIWTCLAKTASKLGEDVDDNEPEYFGFTVDARARLDPLLPAAYFGNCVALILTESTHRELKSEDGFLVGVEAIGELIREKVFVKGELLSEAGVWLSKFPQLMGKRFFSVAGSPKFDLYDTDFGWGKPKKFEALGIDRDGAMSLCKAREFEGGLEIGLSLNKKKMEAFTAMFSAGLEI